MPGLADADPLTTDQVFDLPGLPDSLLVLGAGAVGCELAPAHARFGVEVTLLEAEARVLPAREPDASRIVAAALRDDGVFVVTGAPARRVRTDAVGIRDDLADGSHLRAARLFVATGRRAAGAGLGLKALGGRATHGTVLPMAEADRALLAGRTEGFVRRGRWPWPRPPVSSSSR